MDTTSRYLRIRRDHLLLSVRDLSRRQQGTLIAAAAFLGPFAIAFAQPIAKGMASAVAPGTPLSQRLVVLGAWLLVSSLLVLSLREAVFMWRARPFLATLPIPSGPRFLADARCVATTYSLLWILAAWALYETTTTAGAICLALFIAAGVAIQALLLPLLGRLRVEAPPSGKSMAVRTALALPILLSDSRHATLLRLLAVAGGWIASAAIATVEGQCVKAWGFFLAEAALFAWALHRLPAVVDERARSALPFLFRIPRARVQAVGSTVALMTAVFLLASAAAAISWQSQCAAPTFGRVAGAIVALGAALALVSAACIRLTHASGWASFVAFAAVAIIAGNLL